MSIKYEKGKRYRVMREGARFEGLLLFGEQSISGWSRRIEAGEVLTCLGWKEIQVFGSRISGVMWEGIKVPENALTVQIWPFESLFRPHPMPGLLEPYEDPTTEMDSAIEALTMPTPQQIDEGHIVDLTEHLPEITTTLKKNEDDDEIVDLTGL